MIALYEVGERLLIATAQAPQQRRVRFHRWQRIANSVPVSAGRPCCYLSRTAGPAHQSFPQPQAAAMPSPPAPPGTVTDPIGLSAPPAPTANSSTMPALPVCT